MAKDRVLAFKRVDRAGRPPSLTLTTAGHTARRWPIKKRNIMLSVLADRTYRHLFMAQVIALIGTGLATVALGLLAFDLAGKGAAPCLAPRSPSR